MNKFIRITIKGILMLKIFFQEYFSKCTVIKMSVTYLYNGELLKSNWGDDINYWLFKEIANNQIVNYDWSIRTKLFNRPYVSAIGSILTLFKMDNAIIWGSGIISSKENIIGKPQIVCAVRGPLTRQKLIEQGIDCPEVYGDPALLIPKYYTPNKDKHYKLGIIPHYTDQNNTLLDKFRREEGILIIDIVHYGNWLDFIDQINQCNIIASTSLHGLILSEAYDIPNIWIKLEGNALVDDFKFYDFFKSINSDREPMFINQKTSLNDILSEAKRWKRGSINLQPLIDSCPFELKKEYKITR